MLIVYLSLYSVGIKQTIFCSLFSLLLPTLSLSLSLSLSLKHRTETLLVFDPLMPMYYLFIRFVYA
jgi:hypothetical protein